MNFDPFTKVTKTVYSFYEPITTTTSETNIISSMENNNNNDHDISGVVDSKSIRNETKNDDEVVEQVDTKQPTSEQQQNDGNNENISDEAVDHDHSGHSYDEVVEEESVSEEEEIIEEHMDHTEEEIVDEHNDGEIIEEHLDHSEEEIIEEHMDEEIIEEHLDHSDGEIIEEHVNQVEHVDHSEGLYEEEEVVDDVKEVNNDVEVEANKDQGLSEENDDEKNSTTPNESNKNESDMLPTNQKKSEENETIENVKDDSAGSDEETIEEVEEVEVSDDENDNVEGEKQSSIADNVHEESKNPADHEDLEDTNESGDGKPSSEILNPLNMHDEVKILDDNEDPEDNKEFFSGNSKPSSVILNNSDITDDKAGIESNMETSPKHSASELDESLDIESSKTDPSDNKSPNVLPPLDSKLPDPLEADELMTPTTSAFVTQQHGSADYSTAPLDEIDNNLQVGDEIMNLNVAQHEDNMDFSSLESAHHVVTPVQVSFPPDKPEPSGRIASERPFDEDGDDPTDEGYWRANERATPANGTGKHKKVAPAFRTLSNESAHLKTLNELDDEDISIAPVSTTAAYADFSVAQSNSVPSNEIDEDVSDIDLNKSNDAFTTAFGADDKSNAALFNEAPEKPEDQSNEKPKSESSKEATADPEQEVVEVEESKLGDEKPLGSIEDGNNSAKESTLIDSRDDDDSPPIRDKELLSIDRETSEANESYFSSPFTKGLAILICLLAIALIIALPITMKNNDDDSDREIDIPTLPPTKAYLVSLFTTIHNSAI